MRKNKTIAYAILLICEGKNTEPFYLKSIADKIHDEKIWNNFAITIIPKPIQDDEIEIDASVHKTRRAQKNIKNREVRTGFEIEPAYEMEPVRFVREAQLAKAHDTFDETWAIFDNDSRLPNHIDAAYKLAADAVQGTVKIAYSSIAFEHWFLLHFERNTTAFQKSECREGRTVLNCNSGLHKSDCYGALCIGGYLRHQGYIDIPTKKQESLFPSLEPLLDQALFNATWLRHQMGRSSPPATPQFLMNPITDVDELVKYLLKIERKYTWGVLNNDIAIMGIAVRATINAGVLSVRLTNTSSAGKIIGEGGCTVVDAEFNQLHQFRRELIYSGSSVVQSVNVTEFQNAAYYKFVFETSQLFISLN